VTSRLSWPQAGRPNQTLQQTAAAILVFQNSMAHRVAAAAELGRYPAGVAGVRAIAWIIFVLSVLAIFFCGYAFLFWAWVTATPQTPAQLARAQYNANVWLRLAALSLVAAVVALIWAIGLGRRKA
jgi:hypothetical protein